ncbi:B-cell receptor CD22-like [Oncorhynchus masou masou]|uniref:B-cell receptor CD22-like n=1 Tax=Oncorhynchus masou masou TaxID=90313 RepID=UPI003183B7FC
MALRTAGSVLGVFLWSVAVVLGQGVWSVTYTKNSICALKGSTVDLSCSYTYPRGHKVTTTTWYNWKMGVWYTYDIQDKYEDRIEYRGNKENDCTLTITDLKWSDAAAYYFMFSTKSSSWIPRNDYVTLIVTELQVEVTDTSNRKTLTCITTCTLSNPNTIYIWYKNGQHLNESTSPQYKDSVSSSYDDSYSCAVKGHEDLLSPAVCVQGQSCNRVTYTKRRICVLKGSTVDISCTYGGYYYTTSSFWFRSDKSTPEDLTTDPGYAGRVEYTGPYRGPFTLRITDLREEDSAEYRFTFKTNNFEWGHSFPGTTLSVTGLQVKVTPAAEGQKTLTCITTCTLTDNPTYIWYKNGQRLDEPTSQQYSSNTLVVLGHSVDSYSCAVEHHEDLHSPAVYAPKNTSVSVSPSGEIVEGSSVTLTCSSDANPPVDKYTWYKKNVASPKASGQSYSITNISSEGRGEYYCEAENKYGRLNSSSVSVDVQYTTAVFLWVPVMGMGAVLTVGALLLTIYCYMKRRHTGGSDDTADTQSVHPDPNSDMYTSLNMKTRSPEYDTLANVRDFAVTQPSDTC